MPLPVDYGTGTVTGTFTDTNGDPVVGTISFTPSASRLLGTGAVILGDPVVVDLDADGSISVTLPASNDPNVNPTDFTYRVDETFVGAVGSTYFIDVLEGITLDLSDVAVPGTVNSGTVIWAGGGLVNAVNVPIVAGVADVAAAIDAGAFTAVVTVAAETTVEVVLPDPATTPGGWVLTWIDPTGACEITYSGGNYQETLAPVNVFPSAPPTVAYQWHMAPMGAGGSTKWTGTPMFGADQLVAGVDGPGTSTVGHVATWGDTGGMTLADGGALGGAAALNVGTTTGTVAAGDDSRITGAVQKSLYDANTILAATVDDTPAALTVAASRIVGRKATGDIAAMTGAETMALLTGQNGADFSVNSHKLTSVSDGTAADDAATFGQITTRLTVRARTTGAYVHGALATRSGTLHGATAAGRLLIFPTWLWAGAIDRIWVWTTVAAVSTWRVGYYPLVNGDPSGQTLQYQATGTIDTNATAGRLEVTVSNTVPSSGHWGMAVLVDAYTATPTAHGVNANITSNMGYPRPWAVNGESASGVADDACAWLATGVSTGSTLPTTCPTMTPAVSAPLVGVRYA